MNTNPREYYMSAIDGGIHPSCSWAIIVVIIFLPFLLFFLLLLFYFFLFVIIFHTYLEMIYIFKVHLVQLFWSRNIF